MKISQTLLKLEKELKNWRDNNNTLIPVDDLLHLPVNATFDLFYSLGYCDAGGYPDREIPLETLLNSLCFAIILKHHLSRASRCERGK